MLKKEDGIMYNILPTYSGTDGEKNFSRSSNLNRNGKKVQNFESGDDVLLKDGCHCNQWALAKVINVNADANKDVCRELPRVDDGKGSAVIFCNGL